MTWWEELCSETEPQIWPCSLWAGALPSLSLLLQLEMAGKTASSQGCCEHTVR